MSFYFFTSFLWGSFFVLASFFFSFSFRSNQFLISSFYFFFLSILRCFWFLVFFFFLQFLFSVIFLLFFVISVISIYHVTTNQRKIINSVCIFRLDLCKPYIFLIKNFEFHFLKCYLVVFSTSTQVMSNSVTRQHCSLPIHQNF